ncbi:MAG: AAA family ATPase [Pseudomonadota bacterium]
MNDLSAHDLRAADQRLIEIVRAGLGHFSARHSRQPSDTLAPWDWPASGAALMSQALAPNRPLAAFCRDFALGDAETFLICLTGAIEADHDIGLEIARLQGPGAPGHLQLHLASALARALFSEDIVPLDILSHPLVAAGILSVDVADRPAPFATIRIRPALWAILTGEKARWDDVLPLPEMPAGLASDIDTTKAEALGRQIAEGELDGVLIRGPIRIAEALAAGIGDVPGLLPVSCTPAIWDADPALRAACRYGRWLPVIQMALGPGDRHSPKPGIIDHPAIFVAGRDGGISLDRLAELIVSVPDRATRIKHWRTWTAGPDDAKRLGNIAAIDAASIRSIGSRARLAASRSGRDPDLSDLIAARRSQSAEALMRVAQPVTRQVDPDALILTDGLKARFETLIARCEARETVWAGLGPAVTSDRSRGIHALFVGPSGTGKTIAASHLAHRIGAPLYRLDLSSVMNKYIGETEKNLSAALDEAADLDVVLLMDEADALFGRRSDGEGEGERFGNMLTNFLLTRIETHPGIVVLTSNSRARIDQAFTRRLHAVLEFPPPGFDERLAIWRSHLGSRQPDEARLRLLASACDLAGGFVRTAILSAAARHPVSPDKPLDDGSGTGGHGQIPVAALAQAALLEYEKLGRSVPPELADLARSAEQ